MDSFTRDIIKSPIWKRFLELPNWTRPIQFWQATEFFSSSYFQIGQHVVLLHIQITSVSNRKKISLLTSLYLIILKANNLANSALCFLLFAKAENILDMKFRLRKLNPLAHKHKKKLDFCYRLISFISVSMGFFILLTYPLGNVSI